MRSAKNKSLSDDHESFSVRDRDRIVAILSRLSVDDVGVSAIFQNGKGLLLTRVLAVELDAGTVIMDTGGNESANREITAASPVFFRAQHGGAKTQWVSSAIKAVEFDGHPALQIEIPQRIQHIQHRGSFRAEAPVANPAICFVGLGDGRELALQVVDISAGGIGVMVPDASESALQRDACFGDCRLVHPDLGLADVALTLKQRWLLPMAGGGTSARVGFEMTPITPKDESAIQRFAYLLERRMLANLSRTSRRDSGPARPTTAIAKGTSAEAVQPGNASRILIADDDELMRMVLRGIFSKADPAEIVVVGEAGDCEEAIAKALALKPDIVCLDVMMPKGNGIEVLKRIKSDCPGTAVLMITSRRDKETVGSAAKLGADGYILKPYQARTVANIIAKTREQLRQARGKPPAA